VGGVGDCEKHLHHRVHVAGAAQVLHACEAGLVDRGQLTSRLLNAIPLANLLIQIYLELGHGFGRLLNATHVDAEVGQVNDKIGVFHHVILVI